MKIALVRPNYKSHIITPPLGLGYLSSYLKKNGIDTVIIDGLKERLDSRWMIKRILEFKPDAVGVTCLTAFYSEVVLLSRELKKNKIVTIIGGQHPTFLPYQTLVESQADYVVCGEGEIALLDLARNDLCNDSIQGVYSLENLKNENQEIIKTRVVENMDELPFPDWEQMNPKGYPRAPHGAFIKGFPVGVIVTGRGCPYECTFCATPKFCDRRIRFRTPENVVQEIEHLIKNFQVKEIHFEDDNFTFNASNVEKLCRMLIEKNIKINWACPNGIRADDISSELVRLMRKSGCYCLAYGIESVNSKILKNIKKKETLENISRAIDMTEKAGIAAQGFFIFGLPGETTETIEENIKFALCAGLSRAQFIILDVLPGSELWDTLRGKFVPNWEKESYREPEYLPEGITRKQLIGAQTKAFRRFYLRPKIFFRLVKLIDYRQIIFLFNRIKDYRLFKISRLI
ncbi:MAG: radical SAM protein [Syntrophaceae bacterium]|nr:radical SAM protein [Syntrophaceae bacterium]